MTGAASATLAAVAALATVACTSEPHALSNETAQPPETAPTLRPVTSLAEIEGPWDIVRFDGHEPGRIGADGTRRAYVNVRKDGLSYTIECNYSGNPARIDESGTLHDTGDGMRDQTLMGCGPEIEARDDAFFAFFGTKPKVTRGEGGGLRLSNGRTELILERPDARRLAHVPPHADIAGRWVPRMATRLIGDGGHQGWGFQEPAVVTIGGGEIAYSGCGGFSHRYRYAEHGQMITGQRRGAGRCGDNPGAVLVHVLDKDPLVERTGDGGIALQSGNSVITLQSEEALHRARESPPPPLPPGARTPPPPPPPARQPGANR